MINLGILLNLNQTHKIALLSKCYLETILTNDFESNLMRKAGSFICLTFKFSGIQYYASQLTYNFKSSDN